MTAQIDYTAMNNEFTFVPYHMRQGYQLWIERGISPGGFGQAILCNDLKNAMGRADSINQKYITSTVAWFYNFAPSLCWGSFENVKNWEGTENGTF